MLFFLKIFLRKSWVAVTVLKNINGNSCKLFQFIYENIYYTMLSEQENNYIIVVRNDVKNRKLQGFSRYTQ